MSKAERTLKNFLRAWKAGNFLKMYKYSQIDWKSRNSNNMIKQLFYGNLVEDFEILDYQGVTTLVKIEFNIKVKLNGRWSKPFHANVLCESAPFKPDPKGRWGVNPISVLKSFRVFQEQ